LEIEKERQRYICVLNKTVKYRQENELHAYLQQEKEIIIRNPNSNDNKKRKSYCRRAPSKFLFNQMFQIIKSSWLILFSCWKLKL